MNIKECVATVEYLRTTEGKLRAKGERWLQCGQRKAAVRLMRAADAINEAIEHFLKETGQSCNDDQFVALHTADALASMRSTSKVSI